MLARCFFTHQPPRVYTTSYMAGPFAGPAAAAQQCTSRDAVPITPSSSLPRFALLPTRGRRGSSPLWELMCACTSDPSRSANVWFLSRADALFPPLFGVSSFSWVFTDVVVFTDGLFRFRNRNSRDTSAGLVQLRCSSLVSIPHSTKGVAQYFVCMSDNVTLQVPSNSCSWL